MELNILALDVATKTGYVSPQYSGVWDFKLNKDEGGGLKLIKLQQRLHEEVFQSDINLVAFERTAGAFKRALIHQSELHGVIKLYCEENSISYTAYSASEIKKHATGKGNAPKETMIASAKEAFNVDPVDDNHADALWIYDLACKKYNQPNVYRK